jgi:hypothetical protein
MKDEINTDDNHKLILEESESEKDQMSITKNSQTSFTKASNFASCDASVPRSDTRDGIVVVGVVFFSLV